MTSLPKFPVRAIDKYADVVPDLPERKRRAYLGQERPAHYVVIRPDDRTHPPRRSLIWRQATPWRYPGEKAPDNQWHLEKWGNWVMREAARINAPGTISHGAQVRRLNGTRVALFLAWW